MTADFAGWHDEHLLDHRRRLRTAMFVSLAIHGAMLAIFAAAPPVPIVEPPTYLAVDLVAPAIARPAPAASAPKPAAPSPPPAPAAEPPPPAPPPMAQAPVQVLPEETPGRIRKAQPEPEPEVSKAMPEKKPDPPPRRRRREKAVDYDDAMADLMNELGGDDTTELLKPREDETPSDAQSTGTAGGDSEASPEQVAWNQQAIARISERFRDIARFRNRGLVVRVRIEVAADGRVVGEPQQLNFSSDPDFDRTAIAAVRVAGPFAPPPKPGPVILFLRPESAAR